MGTVSAPAATFADGFGTRQRHDGATPEDWLAVREELTGAGAFEFAVRETAARLALFQHDSFATIRRVERTPLRPESLTVVADAVEGTRLVHVLEALASRRIKIALSSRLGAVRQVLDAVAALHRTDSGIVHGALGPERLIVTPAYRVVVADYVFGAAIEELQYDARTCWAELRIPTVARSTRFDQSTDIAQIGYVVFALLLGRPLLEHEWPIDRHTLQVAADLTGKPAGRAALVEDVRDWIARAVQLDEPFSSAADARDAFDLIAGRDPAFDLFPFAALGELSLDLTAPQGLSDQIAAATGHDEPHFASEPLGEETEAYRAALLPDAEEVEPSADVDADLEALLRFDPADTRAAEPVRLESVGPPVVSALPTRRYPRLLSVFAVLAVASITAVLYAAGRHEQRAATGASTPDPLVSRVLPAQPQPLEPPAAAGLVPSAPRSEAPAAPGEAGTSNRKTSNEAVGNSGTEPTARVRDTAGWIRVSSPIEVQVFEDGRAIGSGANPRLRLSAGRHQLEIVNAAFGYQTTRSVQVTGGQTTSVGIELPSGTVAFNAVPWAEVLLDGQPIGQTPIGNASATVGIHQATFRHPTLGERRRTFAVRVGAPTRISVDLTGK